MYPLSVLFEVLASATPADFAELLLRYTEDIQASYAT